jgi:hypothetical protein
MHEPDSDDHPYFVKFSNNYVNHPTGYTMWNGWGSIAHHSGPMFRYILEKTASMPEKTVVLSSCSDDIFAIPEIVFEQAEKDNAVVIAPILCSFGPHIRKEYMYIPADDQFFVQSLYDIFAPYRIPWDQKIDSAVWRGGLSGEMLRIDAVKACLTIPNTDVKLVDNWPRPEYNPKDTPELFADKIEAYDQCKYKAVFWIDGNCISSNVLWVFATGSVPILINETCFWFKNMIKPWVHYVPVSADFSDLEKNIKWIFENDEEARKIADNALEFCRTQLSPEGQRAYIDRSIEEHIRNKDVPDPIYPEPIQALFQLTSFGNMGKKYRMLRRRVDLLIDYLLKYYAEETKNKAILDKFFSISSEIADLKIPYVDKTMKHVIELLVMEFPDILSEDSKNQ